MSTVYTNIIQHYLIQQFSVSWALKCTMTGGMGGGGWLGGGGGVGKGGRVKMSGVLKDGQKWYNILLFASELKLVSRAHVLV